MDFLTIGVVRPAAALGVGSAHVTAAYEQVRRAVSSLVDRAVAIDCAGACLGAARGCDYLVRTRLRPRDRDLEAHLELVEVRSGRVLAVGVNRTPLSFGVATLDLPLVVEDLLAHLTAPNQELPDPVPAQLVLNEPIELPTVDLTAPAGLSAPVPALGRWVGGCVAYPQHGAVYLQPGDWERYRSHRRRAREPLSVQRWIRAQNEESWTLNFLWLTPPAVLVGGWLGDSETVAAAGLYTLPVAAIAALVDAADIGEIDPCLRDR